MKFLSALLFATAATAAPAFTRDTPACMAKGMKVKQWTAKDFTLSYSTTPTTYDANASFTLENGALSYKANCSAHPTDKNFFNGKVTYKCKINSAAGGDTTFTYNYKTGGLAVSQTWSCAAEGGRIFASGNNTVKPKCTTSTYGTKKTTTCNPITATIPVKEMSAVL